MMQTTTTTRSQASNTAAYEANAHSAFTGTIYTPKRASKRLDLGCMSCGGDMRGDVCTECGWYPGR